MNNRSHNIVYSTDPEWKKGQEEINNESPKQSTPKGLTAYIERDRKQRAGKVVTVISHLEGDLKALQKELQKLCGSGGTVKDGHIEIQGDHRDKIAECLIGKGYKVKIMGG